MCQSPLITSRDTPFEIGKAQLMFMPAGDKRAEIGIIAMANNKGEYTEDKVQIAEVLNDPRFPLKDVKAIVKAISSVDYGVQTEAKYKCCKESCQSINDAVFGISPDFFS
jgi:hypothetical protein